MNRLNAILMSGESMLKMLSDANKSKLTTN